MGGVTGQLRGCARQRNAFFNAARAKVQRERERGGGGLARSERCAPAVGCERECERTRDDRGPREQGHKEIGRGLRTVAGPLLRGNRNRETERDREAWTPSRCALNTESRREH